MNRKGKVRHNTGVIKEEDSTTGIEDIIPHVILSKIEIE